MLANSDDSANTLTGFSTIQLELLGGPTSVCEGISLDLESIPIRDINDLELDSLNFYLDDTCLDQISISNSNVFTEDISIWAKGFYLDCQDAVSYTHLTLQTNREV